MIPAYNEEETIGSVLTGLRQSVPDFDRIVINDGSKDSTGDIVNSLGEKQLRLPSNLGYGQALQTGMKYALIRGYDVVVCFDADGQHRSEDIINLARPVLDGAADMVIGSRFSSGNSYRGPVDRQLGQLLFSHLTRLLLGKRIYDTTSGFKALNTEVCDVLVKGTFMDFHTEALVRLGILGYRILECPITVRERQSGQSMYSLESLLEYPLETLLLTLVATIDALLIKRSH